MGFGLLSIWFLFGLVFLGFVYCGVAVSIILVFVAFRLILTLPFTVVFVWFGVWCLLFAFGLFACCLVCLLDFVFVTCWFVCFWVVCLVSICCACFVCGPSFGALFCIVVWVLLWVGSGWISCAFVLGLVL